jgi:hypothetical protein
MMHGIGLCISTGRAGTTYLAHLLQAAYGRDFPVFHEDIPYYQAKPRRYLWHLDAADFAAMRRDPDVAAYLQRIAAITAERPYIDIGHVATPLVPLVIATFPGRVRLLHLVREPVTSAASAVTFSLYAADRDHLVGPDYKHHPMPPNPIESRCAHPEARASWPAMTPFEKNLWRWAEYNLLALEIHARHPEVPYLKIVSEELFGDDLGVARRVAAFYGLPPRPLRRVPRGLRNATHPNLRVRFAVGPEWRRYDRYPYVLELAGRLGCPVPTAGLEAAMTKYAPPSARELALHRWLLRLTPTWWRQKLRRWVPRPGIGRDASWWVHRLLGRHGPIAPTTERSPSSRS